MNLKIYSSGGGGASTLNELTDVTITSVADKDSLFYDTGTSQWKNVIPSVARTNLGLVAGGAGDIWVEKAGDNLTGNLTADVGILIDGYDISVQFASIDAGIDGGSF